MQLKLYPVTFLRTGYCVKMLKPKAANLDVEVTLYCFGNLGVFEF